MGAKESTEEGDDEAPEDKITDFIEQQTWLDLDDDGLKEPYIVTYHEASGMVVRIVAQYGIEDIKLMDPNGVTRALNRLLVVDREGVPILNEYKEVEFVADIEKWEVVKITRIEMLTKYGFIKDPGGNFLDVGYFYLIGSATEGINSTTNNLLDSGALSNLQGGWLAKGFRKRMGDFKVKPGKWIQTGIDATALQTGVRPFDFKEPSATLLALRTAIKEESKDLANSGDLAGAIGANTPVVTTLALVNEAQQATGAIISRTYRSMNKEFAIWFRLNSV